MLFAFSQTAHFSFTTKQQQEVDLQFASSRNLKMAFSYTRACDIKCERDITLGQIIKILDDLREAMKKYGWRLKPCIEGGFYATTSLQGGGEKSIHFHMFQHGNWPVIDEKENRTEEIWRRKNSAVVLWKKGSEGSLFLKALGGAPVWAEVELRQLVNTFTKHGFACSSIIEVHQLYELGRLGVAN